MAESFPKTLKFKDLGDCLTLETPHFLFKSLQVVCLKTSKLPAESSAAASFAYSRGCGYAFAEVAGGLR